MTRINADRGQSNRRQPSEPGVDQPRRAFASSFAIFASCCFHPCHLRSSAADSFWSVARHLSTAHPLRCCAGSLPAGVVLSAFGLFELRGASNVNNVHKLHNEDCRVFVATPSVIGTFVHFAAIFKKCCICITGPQTTKHGAQSIACVHCSASRGYGTFPPRSGTSHASGQTGADCSTAYAACLG
jgi:hypothetical protein